MADQQRPPKAGGRPKSPKKLHGRGWLKRRSRRGLTWAQRKARSLTYCPVTTVAPTGWRGGRL